MKINSKIISINSKHQKAGNFTYKLEMLKSNDTINLKINKEYYEKYLNESHFIEDLMLGSLGFYYKRK